MSPSSTQVIFASVAAIGAASLAIALAERRRRPGKVKPPPPPPSNRTIHVLYGSQTGTGESFARELAEEAVGEYGLCVANSSAESVESVTDWNEFFSTPKCIVFLFSTYGEGDPSDDAVGIDEYLASRCEELATQGDLGHIKYAIFGLGNKQYALFNAMAKRVDKCLHALGATRVCPTGFGDDNVDIEADYNDWRLKIFWPQFLQNCFDIDARIARENRVSRNPLDRIFLDLRRAPKRGQLPFDATVHSSGGDVFSKAFFAASIVPVTGVTELVADKCQVDVDISKVPSLRYRTGDTLEVIPPNRIEDVNWLLESYRIDGEVFVTFTKKKGVAKTTVKKPFPTPCTVRQAITRYVDLRSRPTRALIRDIAVLMKANVDQLVDEIPNIESGVFTIRSLLEKYFANFSACIELGELIQILPKQKSRAYSICSSPLVDGKKISLVVSRVDDDALASVYLCNKVAVNDTMFVSLRQGTFRLPTLPNQPIVMISVGTGFAPFRAFLAELKIRNRISSEKTILFFGCRRISEWIYREEMEEFQALGGSLHVALSRENPEKVQYVQHLLEQELESLNELINKKNAIIYVCGSTGMGLAVMDVVSKIASVNDLRTKKRYLEELWG